jgi:GNAT superfamily N-acetyltransferase
VTSTTTADALDSIWFRHATPDDLERCAVIWRVAINDYIVRLGQHEIPDEVGPVVRLYRHLQATDPGRFVVACVPDAQAPGGERVVAFAAAVLREHVWYLSMLFVLPEQQGRGLGHELLDRVLPEPGRATTRAIGTDSAQPISNALYATYGVVPRMPLLNLIGLPGRPEAFGMLPSGITPVAFDDMAGSPGDGEGRGHHELVEAVDALDREVLGFSHPADHRFLRRESRHGWLYRGPDGRPVGYGYVGEAGRLGPVLVRDPNLLGPALGHLCSAVQPRGALSTWVPGAADRALVPALKAGFRLEPFPVLLCWDRPPADFERYLPISPGLL